ncbi:MULTISPECIES: ATP-binding protein [Streptomyces]|uniref:ATP-binding protein n=1 Tax=Streptomyces TaxID=1883 RepID=UPI001D049B4D|nr:MULTISPECIES: AAA family ATPase [Streptomyces]
MFDQLIGREHSSGLLGAEIARTVNSHGGLVLIAGEAGIGKTALVTGAAREAGKQGLLVVGGACWDADNAPGHWPWVQVLRMLRRQLDPGEWEELERASAHALGALLAEADPSTVAPGAEPTEPPGTTGPVPDPLPDREEDDPARDGFALFDAVTTALVTASQRRPLMVVIDDLHWADPASLRLLRFAAQHTWFERVLLVGTYRDSEVELGGEDGGAHPVRDAMMPLLARATMVSLGGLDEAQVGDLIERTVGRAAEPELVAEVHRRTGGNPFFVEQTARLWHAGGAVSAVPPGVRDVVRRRVAVLPRAVGELLRHAAVLGREFHRQVLAASLATPPARADRLLEQAVTARLVVQRGSGRFAFAHDLVRETLYAELDEAEARRRHAAVVRALDQQPALADRVVPADLARHAHLAGDEVEPAHALALLRAAAADATTRLAFDEARGHLTRAHALAARADPHRRVLLGLELGEEFAWRDDWTAAWPYVDQALKEARELADPMLSARVALTLHTSRVGRRARLRDTFAELLASAHRGLLPDEDDRPLDPPADPAALDRLARELSVRLAVLGRRGQDDDALAFGLTARHDAIWGPGSAAERAVLTEEMTAVARRVGDSELEHVGMSLRWVALLELGDPDYLKQLREFTAVTARQDRPRFELSSLIDRSVIASLRGAFAESERLQAEAATLVRQERRDRWFHRYMLQLSWSRLLLQGRLAEVDELLTRMPEVGYQYPELLEGITAVHRGDLDAVCRALGTAGEGERYPRYVRALWLRLQAQGAAALGDPERCRAAREALAPFADQWAVSFHGFDVSGPFALWLGEVEAGLGNWAAAVERFAAAALSADRMRAAPWAVEARLRWAEAVLASGEPDAGEEAEGLLRLVVDEAERLGLGQPVGERVRAIREGRPRLGQRAGEEAEFRFDGTVWTLRFAGRTVRLPQAKGLRDLHELLARPGADVPATRLLDPAGGGELVAARSLGGDPVLDDTARAAYRRRLTDLDAEIDRADARGDDAAAARLDEERAALLAELRAAAGLGGRARRLGDEAERARKTVTARIRDTLRRLDEHHPELAEHLRAAVTTGATCGYHPQRMVAWRL